MGEVDHRESEETPEAEASGARGFGRSAKGAIFFFLFLIVVIALVSWLGGDSSTLPLDYDGFD
jgi:hypothetical protein